ncbi:MAG TPA: hypothetical protein VJZ27_18390 [Aggregatilineales bacterium]|nr:hypothetical protein [Aggregatilineales bacterium]
MLNRIFRNPGGATSTLSIISLSGKWDCMAVAIYPAVYANPYLGEAYERK